MQQIRANQDVLQGTPQQQPQMGGGSNPIADLFKHLFGFLTPQHPVGPGSGLEGEGAGVPLPPGRPASLSSPQGGAPGGMPPAPSTPQPTLFGMPQQAPIVNGFQDRHYGDDTQMNTLFGGRSRGGQPNGPSWMSPPGQTVGALQQHPYPQGASPSFLSGLGRG